MKAEFFSWKRLFLETKKRKNIFSRWSNPGYLGDRFSTHLFSFVGNRMYNASPWLSLVTPDPYFFFPCGSFVWK